MATAPLNRILGHLRVSVADAPDAELLQAFLSSRDSGAFAAIVRRHGPTVLNACRQVLRHEADVEDAFQATFVVLLKRGHAIKSQQSLGSWLFGVAHRVAVNAKCRRARLESRERTNEEPPHPAGDPPDLSWREASAILHEELNRLPDKLRLPLLLCYLEGKSRDEAAAELGWSAGMVKGALERGRLRLRDRLQRRGIALSAGLLTAVAADTGSAVPPSWVDSVVSIAGSGTVRPAVSTLARGVAPMTTTARIWATALSVVVLVGIGTLIAASTSPDAAQPPKKDAPVPAAKDATKPAGEKLVVTGKVTDSAGNGIAGAKLYVPYLKKDPPVSEDDIGTRSVGETARDGTYKVEIEKTEVTRYLIVGAEGHAIGWADLENATGTLEATVKLVKDLPVEGRVIDTEGKPVAGAIVAVNSVLAPAEGKLDEFLTGWKNEWNDALRLINDRMYMPLESLHGGGKTDKDGKFALKGIGAERIAVVEVSGRGYAKATVYVVTRAGLDAAPINKAAHDKIPAELRITGQPPLLSGPKADLVVQGTKVIEGTVTDAETGKPMPGVIVTSGSGYNSQVMATADKDGKYRLTGLEKKREYLLHAMMRDERKTSYLSWSARLKDTEALAPIRHDIEMTKGVVVTGRLIDRETGKAVDGSVRLAPLPDNKYFGTRPAYNGYSSERFSHPVENGKFRVVTIPGTAALMAQAESRSETLGGKPVIPYRPAVPDPEHRDYFAKDGDGSYRFNAAGNTLEFLDIFHVCKVVDLKPDAGEVKIDLYLERGKTATVKVEDADGKPLTGATVAGITASWPPTFTLPTDTTTVYALDPARPRTLYLLHQEKKLAGWVRVRGDEKEPVTAKLAPAGSVTGKLVDPDGQPIGGVAVSLQFPPGAGNDLYRDIYAGRPAAVTDKDGAFRVDAVVPGVKFTLSLTKGQSYFLGEPRIGQKQAEAGKTLELGSLTVKGRKFGE
jgi:RNA polymerase sigma factor (sigma-70 family)